MAANAATARHSLTLKSSQSALFKIFIGLDQIKTQRCAVAAAVATTAARRSSPLKPS